MPVLIALILMVAGLGRTDLWGSDETRYAQAAREMRESGDWRHLTVNGRPYTKKPPVVMWAQAGIGAITGGIDEVKARLPNAIGGVASVLLVWLLGNALFGRRAAFLAALLLAATPIFVKNARTGRMDEVLTALVLASLLGFVLWERGRRPRWAVFLLTFAPLWLGVLTKWTAPLFALPPMLLTVLIGGRVRRIPWIATAIGILICALPLALWVDWGEFGRILGGKAHAKPFYFLLIRLPVVSLPAFLLVPGAIKLWRGGTAAADRPGVLLVCCYLTWGLLMLSIPGGKRASYLDPLIPGVALLGGWAAARLGPRWARVTLAIAIVSAAGSAALFHVVMPGRNEARSVRPFLEVYRDRAGPSADLRYLGSQCVLSHHAGPELVFYARRRIARLKTAEDALAWLEGPEERFAILRPKRHRELLESGGGTLPDGLRVEAENRHDGNDYVLVSNRIGDGGTAVFAPPEASD